LIFLTSGGPEIRHGLLFFSSHMISRWQTTSARGSYFVSRLYRRNGVIEKISTTPSSHTQMLIASVPRLDQRWDKQVNVESRSVPTGSMEAVFITIAVRLHLKNARLVLFLSRLSRTILSHAGKYLKYTRNSMRSWVDRTLHRYAKLLGVL